MSDSRDEQIRQTLQELKRVVTAMQRAASPLWLEVDLTMAQVKGLFTLARHPMIPISAFAELLGIGEPSASLLIDRLVKQGLAVRTEDPADRRRTLTALGPRGEELVLGLQHGRREPLQGWLTRLSDDELATLTRGLQALADAAEANPAKS